MDMFYFEIFSKGKTFFSKHNIHLTAFYIRHTVLMNLVSFVCKFSPDVEMSDDVIRYAFV